MIVIRGPFLGKTNNRGGKYDADNDADDVAEERYEEVSQLGMVFYKICDLVVHMYATPSPNYGEEYPRPQQHNKGASQKAHVLGSGAYNCYSSRIWN